MITKKTEKLLLQTAIVLACVVPISAGIWGAFSYGYEVTNHNLDSQYRYLSGLLMGVGLGFLSTVGDIEKQTKRFGLLSFIVVVGGICRLAGFFIGGMPGTIMICAIVMELGIVPLLCWWQHHLAYRFTHDKPVVPVVGSQKPAATKPVAKTPV